MRGVQGAFCDEDDVRVRELTERMAAFYEQVGEYHSFLEPSHHPQFWAPVIERVRKVIGVRGSCRVLEIGAGRSGFAGTLGELRSKVVFDVQDVTARNLEYLGTQADHVFVGNPLEVNGRYDVIFSTFAWEHVTRPRAILSHLLDRLDRDGRVFLACPRYDFPGYLSPSARHLPLARRALLALWVLWRRFRTLASGRAAFLLHVEPAALHGPWFRDADAVHWASLWDLQRALPRQWQLRRIRVPASGLLGRFWERYLLLFVEISRSGPGDGGA